MLGQNFWLGSIKGCEAVSHPHTLTLSNRFERIMHAGLLKTKAPFDIGYRVVHASHTSPWQIQVEFLLEAAVSSHDDAANWQTADSSIYFYVYFLSENSPCWTLSANVV